jgi:hypothetical protein
MSDDCKGCKDAHEKIEGLHGRVSTLETFKEWAEPILNDIKILRRDSSWMITIAGIFIAITSYVYVYQIYPSFAKQDKDKIEIIEKQNRDKTEIIKQQNKDKIEIIKEVQKIRIEMLEKLSTTETTIKKDITKASKMNYKGLKKIIENP